MPVLQDGAANQHNDEGGDRELQALQSADGELVLRIAAFQARLEEPVCPPCDSERSAEHGELPEYPQVMQFVPDFEWQAGYVAGIHRIGGQAKGRQNSSMRPVALSAESGRNAAGRRIGCGQSKMSKTV